ncbi:hypothetical protein C0J52_16954 [Blattella germanica]|nr:hypothetical protein C0J52_16954 [Blattella germanica]
MLGRGPLVVLLILVFTGLAKAHLHMIKLVVMMVLGLAGMWMIHTLAQDYSTITKPKLFSVFKRSANWDSEVEGRVPVDFSQILQYDPLGCARLLVCQLASKQDRDLSQHERDMLLLAG